MRISLRRISRGREWADPVLTDCSLNKASLEGADLRGACMWGCSYWGVELDQTTHQDGIRIASDFDWVEFAMKTRSRRGAAASEIFDITIDDLRVADFVGQIKVYPERVSDMINAASSKFVLLLGRFTGPQRAILDDVLAPGLTRRNYIPMVFDFPPPRNRDVIESVAILAGLSHFVIANLTDARSTPLESRTPGPYAGDTLLPPGASGRSRLQHVHGPAAQIFHGSSPARTYRGRNHLEQLLAEWIIPTAEREATKWNRRKRAR